MPWSEHRLHNSSFLWFICRILKGNPKKELLRSPWVNIISSEGCLSWLLGVSGPRAIGWLMPYLNALLA